MPFPDTPPDAATSPAVLNALSPAALELLRKLVLVYNSASFDQILNAALDILTHAVPCISVDWYDLDTRHGLRRFKNMRDVSGNFIHQHRELQNLIRRHPVMKRFLNGDIRIVYRLSDIVPVNNMKTHPLYRMLIKNYRAPYGLIVRLPIPGKGCIIISMKRRFHDFSITDIATAEVVATLITHQLIEVSKVEARHLELDADRCISQIAYFLNLSQREAEIAYWVYIAKKNKEIGKILGISHHTVRTHIQHIFDKQMISTRFDLARSVLLSMSENTPRVLTATHGNESSALAV